jgi:ubiquinone/menaquinone biosynthesis C-methylase UbiE
MGRFATTASLYEHLRPPYPPEFFQSVAETLKLSKRHALIDLGTGPGLLALGFAPYVGRIVGVDPELAMIAAARAAAARSGQDFALIEGKAEDLPGDIGRFDIVTIGRALHWMERGATLKLLERLLAEDGALLICASSSAADGRNAWLKSYNAARKAWADAGLEPSTGKGARIHRELAAFLDGSPFRVESTIEVETSHAMSISDLAQRVLTYSSSSPTVLGDKVNAMLADVEARLAPFSRDGRVTDVVISTAQVVRRYLGR